MPGKMIALTAEGLVEKRLCEAFRSVHTNTNRYLAHRFCRRYYWLSVSSNGFLLLGTAFWMKALSDGKLNYVFDFFSFAGHLGKMILAFGAPLPLFLVLYITIIRYITGKLAGYLSGNLCILCSYPLSYCATEKDNSITCPECGQRYVPKQPS